MGRYNLLRSELDTYVRFSAQYIFPQDHLKAKREAYDKVRGVFDQAEAARKAVEAAVKAEEECKEALTAAKQASASSADLLANPPHKVEL